MKEFNDLSFDDILVDEDEMMHLVAENGKYRLFETSNVYAGDPPPRKAVETFFPDFNYLDNKDYYIEKDGEILDAREVEFKVLTTEIVD